MQLEPTPVLTRDDRGHNRGNRTFLAIDIYSTSYG